MDPITALNEAREALAEYWKLDDMDTVSSVEAAPHVLDQLAVAFDAIDTWMSKGGFSPWNDNSKN